MTGTRNGNDDESKMIAVAWLKCHLIFIERTIQQDALLEKVNLQRVGNGKSHVVSRSVTRLQIHLFVIGMGR